MLSLQSPIFFCMKVKYFLLWLRYLAWSKIYCLWTFVIKNSIANFGLLVLMIYAPDRMISLQLQSLFRIRSTLNIKRKCSIIRWSRCEMNTLTDGDWSNVDVIFIKRYLWSYCTMDTQVRVIDSEQFYKNKNAQWIWYQIWTKWQTQLDEVNT